MKLRVLWFGKAASDGLGSEIATYVSRTRQRWPAEEVALKPAAGGRSKDPRRALKLEADAARKVMPQGWRLIALDEGGRSVDSVAFARTLEGFEQGGVPGLAFVVGSDLGLDRDLRRSADAVLSLSPMTLPHQLARLILWEQLFRATHILGGGGYHRQGVQ